MGMLKISNFDTFEPVKYVVHVCYAMCCVTLCGEMVVRLSLSQVHGACHAVPCPSQRPEAGALHECVWCVRALVFGVGLVLACAVDMWKSGCGLLALTCGG